MITAAEVRTASRRFCRAVDGLGPIPRSTPRGIRLYAWYMGGDGDVVIVAAPSVEEARSAARAKIREIYLDALWESMYRYLDAPCIRVDKGALFLDSTDVAFAEDDARIAAEAAREAEQEAV